MTTTPTTPAATSVPTARAGEATTAAGPTSTTGTAGTTSPVGTTRTRFAVVVLVSVLSSVAVSTTVVALTGPDAGATGPSTVTMVDPGTAERDAVERAAQQRIVELDGRRTSAICPSSAHPPVTC